ncbi:Glycosyltransferase, catalytic subunit of cellulose synthase and poly-beta-1,6-N-acetylglucosamine synthase [Neorhodopirellula lusitana]|uniref:Glycosyltransferase, catalytic subunit of cellulose synthase and poly-beta-1,6-N-acetylglucosamine synthase n=1 Tax=Neorhodopirellula lusitana TaxID=445327 RepID=A0ABY1QBW6_9BACT|nr:glycosyltransferase [Neorhodopirellula lusitana]SMP66953.1 Glycosyltransferase, catalytic subunit of cellulose synthase and poly-beta-1,6-N-acetylglucosamine synthase [Neorhodopirellula lusitana]
MSESSKRLIRHTSIVTAVTATVIYLTYRGLFTLNLDGIYASAASISLFVAEVYGCFLMFLYFFQIWELVEPEPVPPLENRSVDVYIPTYNEDPDLLRGTISAALALHYEHETYVLDDGNRPAVEELCRELGATYINRDSNLHAKAGNLNHAMEITEGEFVVIFDADHVSRQDFITRLLGYFDDDEMGFVQTPHSFYNFDNFHGTLNYGSQTYWEEGELFYNVIQPGKNYWNGVSFCGSAAMFRRTALEDVGCVATETITEDMHTGLRMHAKGWKSLFVNERLVSGQAATDVSTFNTQRLRWGEGNLGIFAYDNPITLPGLTLAQRLCYLGSMLSWTTGIQKLQLYIAPMLMLLTGVAPVAELSWTLGIITILYMLAIWTAVTVTANGHGNLVGTELTHMAAFWTQIQSCYRAVFKRKKTTFVVTSKSGRQTNSIRKFIMPQCLYIGGSALAIAWATTKYVVGISNDLPGLMVGSLLLLSQCWFAWQVIRRALRVADGAQDSWRHPCALHLSYSFKTDDSNVAGNAVTCDLNETGIGFHAFEEFNMNQEMQVTISAMGLSTTCPVRIRHKKLGLASNSGRDGNASSWRYGCEFVSPSTESLSVIWRLCSDYAVARMYDKFNARKNQDRPESIETQLASSKMARERVNLPITISDEFGNQRPTVTEGLTSTGCIVLLDECTQSMREFRIAISTPLGRVSGTAVVKHVHRTVLGCTPMQFVELQFCDFVGEGRSILLSLCSASGETKVSNVVKLRPPERQLPSLRPAMLAGSLAVAASIIAIMGTLFWNQDDLLISSSRDAVVVSAQTHEKLSVLLSKTLANPNSDENRLVKLRDIFQQIKDIESIEKLNEAIMLRDAKSFTARLCRARTFDGVGQFEKAAPMYAEMLASEDEQVDEIERHDLLISAGRNSANLGDFATAVKRFDQVDKASFETEPNLRREYAGLLAKTGKLNEAINLLNPYGSNNRKDRLLMAQLLAADQHFAQAMHHCQAILADNPSDRDALRLMADCGLAKQQFPTAAYHLERLVNLEPNDTGALKQLALSYLWGRQGSRAVKLTQNMLASAPHDLELQRAFVEATTLVPHLTRQQTRLLTEIATQRAIGDSDLATNELLVSALVKHRQSESLIPLLTELVQSNPQKISLRIQLVDLLEARGDYQLAEPHLRYLMTATGQSGTQTRLVASNANKVLSE